MFDVCVYFRYHTFIPNVYICIPVFVYGSATRTGVIFVAGQYLPRWLLSLPITENKCLCVSNCIMRTIRSLKFLFDFRVYFRCFSFTLFWPSCFRDCGKSQSENIPDNIYALYIFLEQLFPLVMTEWTILDLCVGIHR